MCRRFTLDPLVPYSGGDFLHRVAVVVPGIVDGALQCRPTPPARPPIASCSAPASWRSQGMKSGALRVAFPGFERAQRPARFLRNIHKGHAPPPARQTPTRKPAPIPLPPPVIKTALSASPSLIVFEDLPVFICLNRPTLARDATLLIFHFKANLCVGRALSRVSFRAQRRICSWFSSIYRRNP